MRLRILICCTVLSLAALAGWTAFTAGAEPIKPGTVIRHVQLKALERYEGKAEGRADVVKRGARRQLVVYARLPVTRNREAYEVWLYNSRQLDGYEGGAIESGYRPSDGQAILRLAADGRYEFVRSHVAETGLAPGQHFLDIVNATKAVKAAAPVMPREKRGRS